MELFLVGFLGLIALSWYWVFGVIVAIVIFSGFANDDDAGGETILFIALIAGMGYLVWGQLTIGAAILGVIYYLIVGAVWSIANYSRIIRKEMKADKENGTINTLSHYQSIISKSRIVRWIGYWPFSILGFIVGDIIFEIFENIAEFLKNTYSRITVYFYKKMFGDVDPNTGK